MIIEEQEKVLHNDKKNMLVSASAGSGKTYIMIKYITKLICEDRIPVNNLLVLTFTKAAATEMKERLQKRLQEMGKDKFVVEQIDSLSTANISTIHAFCEKNLKKYANLLGINENFAIADENLSQKIRQNAFDIALKKFNEEFENEYYELISNFKNNKSKLQEIMFEIETLVNSIANKEEFLQKNLNDNVLYFEKATEFLFQHAKNEISNQLDFVSKLHVDDFYFELSNKLKKIVDSEDIYEMCKECQTFSFPYLPKRKEYGDEVVDKLSATKENINKIIKTISDLNLCDEGNLEFQKNGLLEKVLIKLYQIYENEEKSIKNLHNYLDFYDLEKYMKILSVQENLFSGIKYVFVDEYQDTNKIQEKIIKNVAKNCNFVAVGDVKQGIYGFRLASSEIFLKDMEDFSKNDDSTVNFLQSNFRSYQKVLDFVNDIFKVCMTKDVSGVDYEKSSMLKGMSEFVDDKNSPVTIDLVCETPIGKEELPQVYSVKNAQIFANEQDRNQLIDIKRRINDVMSSYISDNGKLRKCRYSDIAILSRNRSPLFNQLENYLQEEGVPVVSNSRNVLLSEPEILVLLNFLKVALNKTDNEVALLSVLMSALSDVSMNDVLKEKNGSDKNLCEIVIEDKNKKFERFNENVKEFVFDVEVFGARKAFLNLFNKTNYRAYLNLQKNHKKLNLFVDKFLNEISSSGFEYDLAGLVNYFETVSINVVSEVTALDDSVLLTTIHNSKGLEYPIVFLIGCDQSLKKSRPKVDVEINEDFGLAVKYYDKENNSEVISAKMRAIQEAKAKKNFVEELMIFYVALTRAKNRLYLFGEYKDSIFERYSIWDCDSYFDLIFFALKNQKEQFVKEKSFKNKILEINLIEELREIKPEIAQTFENAEFDGDTQAKILDYLKFKYRMGEKLNFKLKESVTSLNRKDQEDKLEKFSNESFSFGGAGVETGNAYHLAMKTLNFEKINSISDLEAEINENKPVFEDIENLIDKKTLLQNVLTMKKFVENAKVFKEKEFIMKDKLSKLLEETNFDDEILVQGIIDFFAIRDGYVILVDYKYSNSTSEEYLIKKYKNQLKLYKNALENALKMPVNEIYLLSLKDNNLIKVQI